MTINSNLNKQTTRFNFKLWKEYIDIAQLFWYPGGNHGAKKFMGLIALLLVFVAVSLYFSVVFSIEIANFFIPSFFSETIPGFYKWSNNLLHSKITIIAAFGFFLSSLAFVLSRKRLSGRSFPWIILGFLLLLSFSVSGLNVIISYVGRFFQTALAEKQEETYWRYLFLYASVFVVGTPIVVLYGYTRQKLGNKWREWIATHFIDKYFNNRAYYELSSNKLIDNPDQRITEDLNGLTATSLSFLLIILGAVIDLAAFSGILWSISKKLSFFLIIYATAGTIITIFLGKKLVSLNFNQLKKEADLRYGLIHVRDNAESVAFYKGEKIEKGQILHKLKKVIKNYNFLIGWQRNLDFFTTSYSYFIIIIPSLLVAPAYFAGQIEFGQIAQAGFAFSQILGALSIIVSRIESITAFAAGINRVTFFNNSIDNAVGYKKTAGHDDLSGISRVCDSNLSFDKFTLKTPDYARTLITDLSFTLNTDSRLLIVGASGAGKSSILRAVAGLWNSGTGTIRHPDLGKAIFLPQIPYMLLGNLKEQICYPANGDDISISEIRNILTKVNLADLPDKILKMNSSDDPFNCVLNWDEILSQGEKQRLAFSRILSNSPNFVILDEATSALDPVNERLLYSILADMKIPFVSVGHRPSLVDFHTVVLKINPDTSYVFVNADDYKHE